MTKNLFLLFSLYFFVVQALIVGALTGDSLFYKLGAINAGAILIIILLYFLFTKNDGEEPLLAKKVESPKPKEESTYSKIEEREEEQAAPKEKVLEEKKESYVKVVQPLPPTPKKRRKSWGSGQWRIFLITLIISIAIHFIICEFFTYRSPLISLFLGYILFVVIGKISSLNGFEKVRKLITTWIYIFLILLAGGYAGAYMAEKGEIIEQYLPELWEVSSLPLFSETKTPNVPIIPSVDGPTTPSSGEYIYEGSGEVLSGSWEDYLPVGTGGESGTGEVIVGSGMMENPTVSTGDSQQGAASTTGTSKEVSMMDAIKHVIDVNTIPLSTKTDISFTSLSTSHANYAYFRTAYEKKMIGKNTDPSKQISCETYMVIKGLGEGRAVGSYSNVKAAYRQKAQELEKLNGCKKWGWVTTATL